MATEEEAVVTEEVTTTEEVTEEVTEKIVEEPSMLELDDDAFMALMASADETPAEEKTTDTEETPDDDEDAKKDDDDSTETEDKTDEEDKPSDDSTKSDDEEEKDDTDTADIEKELTSEDTDKDELSSDDKSEDDKSKKKPQKKDGVEQVVDKSLQLDEIYKPFKANGKEMTVDNVDDVRTLMQMGANYNKKMAALKPNLKLLKMLENNGLLDEDKISFLIDLDKKDPDAIIKLVKDSKIDPDKLDTDEESKYKPNTYTVNDTEVDLDETLNDIRDTPSYAETLNIISNKWDESSKAALLANPTGIKILNDHVQMGIYEKISAVVTTERMFGRIPAEMSDLEAYKFIGDKINANGGFASDGKSTLPKAVSKATKKVVDPKLNEKKKAASSTKGTRVKSEKIPHSPLAMSDAEFEKTGLEKFI